MADQKEGQMSDCECHGCLKYGSELHGVSFQQERVIWDAGVAAERARVNTEVERIIDIVLMGPAERRAGIMAVIDQLKQQLEGK
jgi:hypothetical protein